jgi:hypothetical protein
MKKFIPVVGLAIASLAACGSQSHAPPHPSATATPLSCQQQYDKWRTGPAKPISKLLVTDLDGVSANADAGSTSATVASLKSAAGYAEQLKGYNTPKCADPGGLWEKALGQVVTAGSTASPSNLVTVLAAAGPLQTALLDLNGISTELAHAGVQG